MSINSMNRWPYLKNNPSVVPLCQMWERCWETSLSLSLSLIDIYCNAIPFYSYIAGIYVFYRIKSDLTIPTPILRSRQSSVRCESRRSVSSKSIESGHCFLYPLHIEALPQWTVSDSIRPSHSPFAVQSLNWVQNMRLRSVIFKIWMQIPKMDTIFKPRAWFYKPLELDWDSIHGSLLFHLYSEYNHWSRL